MKIRTGFVSNSSSSSFMIGVGIVADKKKFDDWMSSLDERVKESISVINPWTSIEESWGNLTKSGNWFDLEAPVNSGPSATMSIENYNKFQTIDPEDFVILSLGNGEGDSAFLYVDENGEPDDYGELDYNIDLDWFSNDQSKLFSEFGSEKSGIICSDKTYGAERNG